MKSKRTRRTGFILCLFGVVLLSTLGLFFYLSLKEDYLNRSLQESILNFDKEMQTQIDLDLNHDELEKHQMGLVIFRDDTLVYWNRNDVNPKLIKRNNVIGHDTICALLSGNYYVKSFERGNADYYVYKLINTTYQIDNAYFSNENRCIPRFVDADILVLENGEGKPVVNDDGKVNSEDIGPLVDIILGRAS